MKLLSLLLVFGSLFILCMLALGADSESKGASSRVSIHIEATWANQTDSLTELIEQAHLGAMCTLERFFDIFERQVWQNPSQPDRVTAWNTHPDLVRWMGRVPIEGDSSDITAFRTLLQQMIQRLNRREIVYQVEEGWLGRCELVKTQAFVRPRDPEPTIHLCPAWFEQSPVHRVATIIHELVHTFGYGHPRGVDLPLEALALARDHPADARVSPENFESLMELYVCFR